MDKKTNEELTVLIGQAIAGDKQSLETIILSVKDLVFNLSLRMLGTFADAEDATQDILLKIITHLSSFQKNSLFTTWVFRIATNHLKNYKKHMFAHYPFSFEYYGGDIESGQPLDLPDLTQGVDQALLEEELKMSCTNVMLQCLDPESRCIFVLGTMFQVDSRIAGEILGLTPETYRQRLSRIRKKMAAFLSEYCGEYGCGVCKCRNRIQYAIHNHRINPLHLDYAVAEVIPKQTMAEVKGAMEDAENFAQEFSFCKTYATPETITEFIKDFLNSTALFTIKKYE